jgi:hypothetical protein
MAFLPILLSCLFDRWKVPVQLQRRHCDPHYPLLWDLCLFFTYVFFVYKFEWRGNACRARGEFSARVDFAVPTACKSHWSHQHQVDYMRTKKAPSLPLTRMMELVSAPYYSTWKFRHYGACISSRSSHWSHFYDMLMSWLGLWPLLISSC